MWTLLVVIIAASILAVRIAASEVWGIVCVSAVMFLFGVIGMMSLPPHDEYARLLAYSYGDMMGIPMILYIKYSLSKSNAARSR